MKSAALAKKPLADLSERLEVAAETPGGTFSPINYPASPEECGSLDSEAHKKHVCYLKAKGLEQHIKILSKAPTIECHHCGAKVNCAEHVCAAHMGEDAPNVEGGHGMVGVEQVGKSHAC